MFKWAAALAVLAGLAALVGVAGVYDAAAGLAQILFGAMLVGCLATLAMGVSAARKGR